MKITVKELYDMLFSHQIEAISCYTGMSEYTGDSIIRKYKIKNRDKLGTIYVGTVSDELENTYYHVYIHNDCISIHGYKSGKRHSCEIKISDFKSYIRERKIVEVLNGI